MKKKVLWQPIIITSLAALFIAWGYHTFVYSNPVFEFSEKDDSYLREVFFNQQDQRIERAVRRSYAELMAIADAHMRDNDLFQARKYYYEAKTLYPEKMGPRKHLCYIDILLCQRESRYCSYTKREIYYAMRHTNEEDPVSKDYIQSLATLMNMDSIIHMEESQALSEIF